MWLGIKMNEMISNGIPAKAVDSKLVKNASLQPIFALHMDGRLEEAHDAYVSYFEQHDIDYPALNMFGICCMALGRFDKASGLFSHIVENAPMIEEAALHLAECQIELSDPDAALCILEAPCKDNDSDHKPHLRAARAYILKDERNVAMNALRRRAAQPLAMRFWCWWRNFMRPVRTPRQRWKSIPYPV